MNDAAQRVAWVDYGKGFCIVLVVMMHSTLGVEAALGRDGFLHAAVEFARPFRIPAFFLISGLFLARVIDRDWRDYCDRKVAHFAYFYVLWVTIQFALRFPGLIAEQGAAGALLAYLKAFVDPFGTLWFIYLLPFFFVATKLLRGVPVIAVWILAAALEIAPVQTGSVVIDEFASRFVYFYTGYVLAGVVFRWADTVSARPGLAAIGLVVWGALNGAFVHYGYAELALVSLALGLVGSFALVAAAALLSHYGWLRALQYCGRNSLIIYLAFSVFMAAVRVILVRTHLIEDAGEISLLVTLAAVIGPLLLHRLIAGTRLNFLFERPQFFRLTNRFRLAPQR